MKSGLSLAPEFLRIISKPQKAPVERAGGMYEAGLIRGFAVITRGEALGHGVWIDAQMLDQVTEAMRAAGEKGLKSRFTHPGLSSDGMGTQLGRVNAPVRAGDVVRGDLHLMKSAHTAPDGDLAGFVMDLAEEDAGQFGASIVFMADKDAMRLHEAQHTKDGQFHSPDQDNKQNLPHVRLKQLRAVDVVDSPAANPDGFFHAGRVTDLFERADEWTTYALGLADEPPPVGALGIEIDASRVRGFVERTLAARGLRLLPAELEQRMSKDANPAPAPSTGVDETKLRADAAAAERERFGELRKRFAENPGFAAEMYEAGKSVKEAESEFNAREVERLRKENEELKKSPIPSKPEPRKPAAKVGFSASDAEPADPSEPRGAAAEMYDTPFWEKVTALRAADAKLSLRDACSRVAREHPDLYTQHKEAIAAA